jgi:polysaccharide biosynthesis/export protein
MKTSTLHVVGCACVAALLAITAGCRHADPHYAYFASPAQAAPAPLEAFTVTNQLDPAWLKPPSDPFTLGPGDRLEIELLDETGSRVTTVVGPDGKLYFHLLQGLDVWGRTLGEVKGMMERELSQYIREQPRVNITLRGVESKRVWLLGRFQQAGVYNMPAPMTLLEAISMAGGGLSFSGTREAASGQLAEELADLRRSFVVRQGEFLPVDLHRLLTEGDISQNIYLQPDDFVYFAPTTLKEVYVIGAVVQPRPVLYSEGMTVAAAIAGAFGTAREAYLSQVAVVRGSLSQPQIAIVDYHDVVRGRAPDIELQPHDIVYVPYAPYRYLTRYANIILNTFVSSVAINAGTRFVAGERGGPGAGVFIPVGSGIQISPPPAPPIGR